MSNTLFNMLDKVRQEHGLLYGVVCSPDGQTLAVSGNAEALKWKGLLTTLFGSPDAIVALNESLANQILPQLFSQGDMYCIVMKPSKEYLIGLFGQGSQDAITLFREGKKMSQEFEKVIRSEPSQ